MRVLDFMGLPPVFCGESLVKSLLPKSCLTSGRSWKRSRSLSLLNPWATGRGATINPSSAHVVPDTGLEVSRGDFFEWRHNRRTFLSGVWTTGAKHTPGRWIGRA